MDYKEKYEMALETIQEILDSGSDSIKMSRLRLRMQSVFCELKESEDERIRKGLINYFNHHKNGINIFYGIKGDDILAWLEKQGKSSDQIHYWTEEEIEPIISDYLRGAEHYGGMIARLRCLKPKSLEKQGETYTKRDVDDAWLEGMCDAKRELEKQSEQKPFDYENANIQQRDWAETPFGAKDSELQEVTYLIPEGFHAEIKGNEVFIKKGEQKPTWSEEDEKRLSDAIFFVREYQIPTRDKRLLNAAKEAEEWLKSLKERVGG